MINAKDLRLGNLVEYRITDKLDERKEWWEVSEIDADDIHWLSNVDSKDEDFRPIKLTDEWLNKLGFFIVETNGKFEATLPNFRYNIYWTKHTDGFLFCDGETALINFNYLHELQNLVFYVGQRELTVA